MATTAPAKTATLTPHTDQRPAVVDLERELSGPQWCKRFPGSHSIDDLVDPFKRNTASFLAALRSAGASVDVSATFRPKERAYLMHWSWNIAQGAKPESAGQLQGVDINWVHDTPEASRRAAQAMVIGFDMKRLGTAPALATKHFERTAIDMSISWTGDLTISDANNNKLTIATAPRTGMNAELHAVGRSYGVHKYFKGDKDRPHWSDNGH